MGDNSSDEDLQDDWVPYSERPEWSDIQPLPQDDGESPVVVISYSDKFRDVYDYFRAIVSKREKSLRALELTKDALKLNAANYTVWQYRRDILKELGLDLYPELEYTEDIMIDNPKNYQVWHHRRVIVEWINDPSREMQLTEEILNMDSKNYHAWQHRQWSIQTYNMFDEELIYVDKLISEDVRNNSAWNQRFFVLKHTKISPEVLQREINYVMNRIRLVKNNESTWNFLRGLLQEADGNLYQNSEVVDFCEELFESGVRSPYLIAFLIDMYEEQCLRKDVDADPKDLSDKVLNLCSLMISKHDTIRQKFWEYVMDSFKVKLAKSQQGYENTENTKPAKINVSV